jgi:hypothetical protein
VSLLCPSTSYIHTYITTTVYWLAVHTFNRTCLWTLVKRWFSHRPIASPSVSYTQTVRCRLHRRSREALGTESNAERYVTYRKHIHMLRYKVIPVLNYIAPHRNGLRRYSSTSLHLCTICFIPLMFNPGERAPNTLWIGGWVRPHCRSGCCGEDENLASAGNPNSFCPSHTGY